jgi:small-conductance mechanosensitive channel
MDALVARGSNERYRRTESWISYLTVILGAVAGMVVGLRYQWRWGLGIMIGAALAWLNFRWLRQGLDVLTKTIAAQAKVEDARLGRRPLQSQKNADIPERKGTVPVAAYFKALFRYALIALIVYVIFKYLNVPVLSMVLGLCALGAATLAVSVHEILRPQE